MVLEGAVAWNNGSVILVIVVLQDQFMFEQTMCVNICEVLIHGG